MEDNLQTIIVLIISTFLLFIFPVYTAYEKKDDISYALAMRYTQDFVNDVRSKGYLTIDMYKDYQERLRATGNTYDIELIHQYNRYDPITNYYEIKNGKYVLAKTSTIEERKEYENVLIQKALTEGRLNVDSSKSTVSQYLDTQYQKNGIYKVEDTYMLSAETYITDYILNVLNGEKKLLINSKDEELNCSDESQGCQYAYIMNVGDTFNVTIKNTNITFATVMYNMVTAHTLDSNTRIYVNYGGAILSSKWYGDIDYAQSKHDDLSLTLNNKTVIFPEERHYYTKNGISYYPTANISLSAKAKSKYTIEFEAKPEEVTELRAKGKLDLITYEGYNFAIGTKSNGKNRLVASVGLNGISLLVTNESTDTVRKAITFPVIKKKDTNEFGNEQIIQIQAKASDYLELNLGYEAAAKRMHYYFVGKDTAYNIASGIDFTASESNLWKGFTTIVIENPTQQSYKVGTYTDYATGEEYEYIVQVSETFIQLKVERVTSKNYTILSYATKIEDYVKIKIELNEQQDGKYIATLYLDDAKVGESSKMDILPTVDVVGKTVVGGNTEYFSGYIRNVKIYEMGD